MTEDIFNNLEKALERYKNRKWMMEEMEMFEFLEEKDFEGVEVRYYGEDYNGNQNKI